jgi:hypothetical protein
VTTSQTEGPPRKQSPILWTKSHPPTSAVTLIEPWRCDLVKGLQSSDDGIDFRADELARLRSKAHTRHPGLVSPYPRPYPDQEA